MSFLKYALVMLHEQHDAETGQNTKAQLNLPATEQNTALIPDQHCPYRYCWLTFLRVRG